jgi:hypothetical protein
MANYNQIQNEIYQWSITNFENNCSKKTGQLLFALPSFLGIVEEIGEYHEANNDKDEIDALADCGIYLLDFCNREGIESISNLVVSLDKHTISTKEAFLSLPYRNITIILGKLSHCILKHHQGIRDYSPQTNEGMEKYKTERNLEVYHLLAWLEYQALLVTDTPFITHLENTWSKVKKRNWKANPSTAHVEPQQ